MTPSPRDRYRGCLLGGAAGDALGAAVEFESLAAIRARFGPDGIRDPAPAYGRVGAITDDTQMTLFTAEGLLQATDRLDRGIGHPPSMLLDAYGRWLWTQGVEPAFRATANMHGELHRMPQLRHRRAPGATCLSALQGPRPDAGDADLAAANDSKGCGGVMRAAPCGLIRWTSSPFGIGEMTAGLTHGHPSGRRAAGALAVIVHELTEPEPAGVDAAVGAALQALREIGDREVHDALQRALDAARSGRPPSAEEVAKLGEGWVAEEALAIAAYCVLACPGDLAAAVRLAANHSGDSDSTAAIAGNIAGAALGVRAIPVAWLDVLELRGVIDRLAIALYDRSRGDVGADWDRWQWGTGAMTERPE
jgi:ADP-ribosyl-[dinitrogen reductase] hydrolase